MWGEQSLYLRMYTADVKGDKAAAEAGAAAASQLVSIYIFGKHEAFDGACTR